MNALDYPEILEALENGTIPSRTIGGVVAWIQNEIGLAIEDVYITFREEILNLVEGVNFYEPYRLANYQENRGIESYRSGTG